MKKANYIPPLRLCFFMWLSFSIELFGHIDLGVYGIFPRSLEGLIGILLAPVLHGNFQHLVSNTIPLLVLGTTLFFFYPSLAGRVFVMCYVFTNVLVWIFARPFYHIGASGLIYALASFLVFYGFFTRHAKSIMISVLVIVLYGGLAFGLFSFHPQISWESHLLGAVAGYGIAYANSRTH